MTGSHRFEGRHLLATDGLGTRAARMKRAAGRRRCRVGNFAADGQARHALMLLLGLDPYLKLVVAVDEDVDVFDEEEVLWALATRFQADTDMFMVPQVFCNRLDPSSRDGMSAKLALDATAPLTWDVERAVVPRDAAARARPPSPTERQPAPEKGLRVASAAVRMAP